MGSGSSVMSVHAWQSDNGDGTEPIIARLRPFIGGKRFAQLPDGNFFS
jgi:hypothetical protein